MALLKKRLPEFRNIIPVYAVAAFMLFGWSLVLFAWKLPSWLNFMTVGYLLATLSYSVVLTLGQTLAFMLFLLAVCFILPGSVLREHFVVRGALIAISLLGVLFLRAAPRTSLFLHLGNFSSFAGISVLLVILLSLLSAKVKWFARAIAWLADALTVFLYILFPLSAISLLVVFIRNVA